jgi:hypothetical protein
MKSVKMMTDVLGAPKAADRWYVTNGTTAVGPVNLELLARGIEAGKVQVEGSFVRHEAWKVWRPLSELAVVTTDAPPAPVSESSRPTHPLPVPSTDDITSPGRPILYEEMTASDALAGAADLRDALLLLLAAAVQKAGAEAAILYEVTDEGPVVVCAHGPDMFEALGENIRFLDPDVIAAAGGAAVVAEPTPGPAGQAIIERMSRLGVTAEGAFMMPIRPRGRLLAMLELGRPTAFRAREIAEVEELVEALIAKIILEEWA